MKNLKETQILTSNYPYGRYSLDYALDSLQRLEAGPIEFYACYPHFHLDDVDYWDVKRITRKLIEHKLNIVCFTPEQCLYPVNIAALDPAARKRSMDVFKKSIQFGADMVPWMKRNQRHGKDPWNPWESWEIWRRPMA